MRFNQEPHAGPEAATTATGQEAEITVAGRFDLLTNILLAEAGVSELDQHDGHGFDVCVVIPPSEAGKPPFTAEQKQIVKGPLQGTLAGILHNEHSVHLLKRDHGATDRLWFYEMTEIKSTDRIQLPICRFGSELTRAGGQSERELWQLEAEEAPAFVATAGGYDLAANVARWQELQQKAAQVRLWEAGLPIEPDILASDPGDTRESLVLIGNEPIEVTLEEEAEEELAADIQSEDEYGPFMTEVVRRLDDTDVSVDAPEVIVQGRRRYGLGKVAVLAAVLIAAGVTGAVTHQNISGNSRQSAIPQPTVIYREVTVTSAPSTTQPSETTTTTTIPPTTEVAPQVIVQYVPSTGISATPDTEAPAPTTTTLPPPPSPLEIADEAANRQGLGSLEYQPSRLHQDGKTITEDFTDEYVEPDNGGINCWITLVYDGAKGYFLDESTGNKATYDSVHDRMESNRRHITPGQGSTFCG